MLLCSPEDDLKLVQTNDERTAEDLEHLRVLRKSALQTDRLFARLRALFEEQGELRIVDAWTEFLSDLGPPRTLPRKDEGVFSAWLLNVLQVRWKTAPTPATAAGHYLRSEMYFDAYEAFLLRKFQEQRPAFYRVSRGLGRTGLRFENLLADGSADILDNAKCAHLNQDDLVFAMICPIAGASAIALGCGPALPARFGASIMACENLSIAPKNLPPAELFDRFASEIFELYDEVSRGAGLRF